MHDRFAAGVPLAAPPQLVSAGQLAVAPSSSPSCMAPSHPHPDPPAAAHATAAPPAAAAPAPPAAAPPAAAAAAYVQLAATRPLVAA